MSQHLATLLHQQGLLENKHLNRSNLSQSNRAPTEANFDVSILESLSACQLASAVSKLFDLPLVDINDFDFTTTCEALGLGTLIQKYHSLPLQQTDRVLTLAVADPTLEVIENEFRFATGLQVELVIADYNRIIKAIYSLYGRNLQSHAMAKKEINAHELEQLVDLSEAEIGQEEDLGQDNAPVSRYIHQILLEAIRKEASDIHFEPYEKHYRVRLRCDGLLVETHHPASQLGRRLSTRLKILANLDIAERRRPQDGRTKIRLNADLAVDMRISTLPTLWGEKVVLRLLESGASILDIEQLGYNKEQKDHYLAALKKPQGLILITGPTGSGKTVSLYTGLNILNTAHVNIATAEDPVEINLTGINQVQVQPQIDFDFAAALRSFLRQDPDIIMVGEVRDLETAEIAIKAAQTGHLVLSTLHTNSAAETLVRLRSMGIKAYDLASSLSLVIAQRLVRKLCPYCKFTTNLNSDEHKDLSPLHSEKTFVANPTGCTHCNHGYQGRIGLFEVMKVTPELQQAMLQQLPTHDIEAIAKRQGMMTLQESGIAKLRSGETSQQELQRVLFLP